MEQQEGGQTVSAKTSRPSELRGNTLRVYLYLLKKGPSELRDVQRALEMSTPSLASYHLEKLTSTGFAAQNEKGEYCANRDSLSEVVDGFSKVGALIVPQLLFVAVLFTPLVVFFGYMALQSLEFVPALAASAVGLAAVTWFEAFRAWRKLSGS